MEKDLWYSIYENGIPILEPSEADLLLTNNLSFSFQNSIKSHSIKKVTNGIISPVPEKRKKFRMIIILLSIAFKRSYKIEFRVYDDGVAYRF